MNKAGWESMGKPEAVEFMFDKNRDVVGLKKVPTWQENSFPVRAKKGDPEERSSMQARSLRI